MGKREFALNEQFFLFRHCFLRLLTTMRANEKMLITSCVLVLKFMNFSPYYPYNIVECQIHVYWRVFGAGFYIRNLKTESGFLTTLRKKAFENIVGKGENASNIFPQCFLIFSNYKFWVMFILLSASSFNLDLCKELTLSQTFQN